MYQWLLVRKYLFSKIMPLLAALAVVLCTAMVLVTWSVMGGFLDMFIRSGRTVTGDVVISWPNVGFAYSDELVQKLQADPMVAAATPVIETYGLLGLPDGQQKMVIIRGIDPKTYSGVTSYNDILWWKPLKEPLEKDEKKEDPRLQSDLSEAMEFYERNGRALSRIDDVTGEEKPAVVLGIEVSGFNWRMEEGFYKPQQFVRHAPDGSETLVNGFLPRDGEVVISVLPLSRKGGVISQKSRRLPVANEFQSGLFEADEKVVFLRLDVLQEMLEMQQASRIVEGTTPAPAAEGEEGESFAYGEVQATVIDPARVTQVLVRGKGDLGTLGAARPLAARVEEIYAEFATAHRGEVPGPGTIQVMTWEDQNRTMIAAVQKETGLLLFLFSLISLVAVFLVLAIFWSMIAEKTKDIGIMRALGAGRLGVAGVWVGYGLAIGVVGAVLGGVAAYFIVHNINPIHEWIGTITQKLTGDRILIWDPRIYYFSVIPNTVDPQKAAIVLIGGVLSSAIGAIVPAWRAAAMHPVRALRFE